MTQDRPDLEAALLYHAAPRINPFWLEHRLNTQARRFGVTGPVEVFSEQTTDDNISLTAGRTMITLSVLREPLESGDFDAQIRALNATLNGKAADFDFRSALDAHQSAIVISVSDAPKGVGNGATSASQEGNAASLTLLHLAMQAISAIEAPLMADFQPTQTLLSPHDLSALSNSGLPLALFSRAARYVRDTNGQVRALIASHTELLIGKRVELQAVPEGVEPELMAHLLSALIEEHIKGRIALADGDILQDGPDAMALHVRHEGPDAQTRSGRLVVSFDANGSTSIPQDNKATSAGPHHKPSAPLPRNIAGKTGFQERVEKMKAKAQPEQAKAWPLDEDPLPPAPDADQEAAPPAQNRFLSVGTRTFVAAAMLVGAVYLINPGALVQSHFQTQSASLPGVDERPGEATAETVGTTVPPKRFEDAGAAEPAHARTDAASTDVALPVANTPSVSVTAENDPARGPVLRIDVSGANGGSVVVTGRDADGNPVTFSEDTPENAGRDDSKRRILAGTLRSELVQGSQ